MSKTYMQKESKKGKRKGDIVCVSLADWQRYRMGGYAFVETDDSGATPEQQFRVQESGKSQDRSGNADEGRRARKVGSGTETDDNGEGVSMSNSKPEILAYLSANDIEADEELTKAELLELLE